MHRPIVRIGALLGAAVLISACGSGSTTSAPTSAANPTPAASSGGGESSAGTGGGGSSIDATESEYKIEVSATTTDPGDVTFHVTNGGTQPHEFVVIKTDTAADALPTDDDGTEVDEDAEGLTVVDEVEDLDPGATADLDVTLDAGHYALICNVPGHYQLGMHTDFTVGT